MRLWFSLLILTALRSGAAPHLLSMDFNSPNGEIRPLHGINRGPLCGNGIINLTEQQKRLRLPSNRLHDCQHPNPHVVDVHSIFQNPDADPALPESYDFRATDEYIAAVQGTGAQIIYRLGESIEHQTVKRYVNPPHDPKRWAEVCSGIVRHYNNGWAHGAQHGIRYWEIWNEPENRPVMWTGTDAQFLELYKITALRLRTEFPGIKIGGPGFGYCGKFDGVNLEPSEFSAALLEQCRRDSVPLDFLSWHCYTDNPSELAARAKAVRRILDERGFTKTESHLNEWNYLPDSKWDILARDVTPEVRQHAAERMAGAEAAAFIAASLIELQDAPVDVANFYHAEGGIFGLFTEVGAPTTNYYGMLAFSELLDTPKRVRTAGGLPGKLVLTAGTNAGKTKAAMLVANFTGPEEVQLSLTGLPWAGESAVEVRVVDGSRKLEPLTDAKMTNGLIVLKLPPPVVVLVTLRAK